MSRLAKFDIVSIEDLETSDIERVFALADDFYARLERGEQITTAAGLIMATLFYEPSTRTRLSFESSMHRLGGAVISSADMQASSAAKGESLADTVRVVAGYADLIVLRHPHDGAARVAAEYAPCPVLNAGDGSREHPTQTLCDLYILRKKKGHLKGLTVALCGDLKFGRTVHSLIYALARFGANIVAAPVRGMGVPEYVLERLAAEHSYNFATVTMDELKSAAGGLDALYLTPGASHQMALFTGHESTNEIPSSDPPAAVDAFYFSKRKPQLCSCANCSTLHSMLGVLDAFYVTRLQKERLVDHDIRPDQYVRFDVNALKSDRTKKALVMHPLPRTTELAHELDTDPRAIYFEQAAVGVPVRMALIAWLMEKAAAASISPRAAAAPIRFKQESPPLCANVNCISRSESAYLAPRFSLGHGVDREALKLRCQYCERELRVEYVGHARSHRYYRFDENLQGYVHQWIEEGSLAVFDSVKQAEEGGYEPYRHGPQREVMNEEEVGRAIDSIASQVVADIQDMSNVSIVGIVSKGAMLGLRIRSLIGAKTGVFPPCASLDVYKLADALQTIDGTEHFEVEGRAIVLVDDVINSGWTVQRAMATIWQRGRPASVRLAVLIDRGHRAVPIRPNYVGKNIPTTRTDRLQVRLANVNRSSKAKMHDHVTIYSIVEPMKEPEAAH